MQTGRSLQELATQVCEREAPVRLTGLRGAARAAVAAELVRAHRERAVLFLVPGAKAGDALLADLRCALGSPDAARVLAFPRHDTLPYDHFSPQPFVVAQRTAVLHLWLEASRSSVGPAPVAVAPWTALALRVPTRAAFRRQTAALAVGDSIERDELLARLVAAGYASQPMVEERGEVAARGGIVDFFPPHCPHPVRVDLLGDEVESLRAFDPASQRSQAKLESVSAPPPRELCFERDDMVDRADDIRALAQEQGLAPRAADELVDALLRGHVPPGAEAVAPLVQGELESVFDYLPPNTLVVVDDPSGETALERYVEEADQGFRSAREAGRLAVPPETLLLSPDEVAAALEPRLPVCMERLEVADLESAAVHFPLGARGHEELRRGLSSARTTEHALEPLVDQVATWMGDRWRTVLACSSLSGAERLRSLLSDYGVETTLANDTKPIWSWSAPGRVEVRVAALSEGFRLPGERLAIVTDEEIFGPRERRRKAGSWQEGTALEGIAQLGAGDYVVHDEHGIGIYRGLVELEVGVFGHVKSELLCIEYAGGDRFFLPVHRLNHVARYAGADGAQPRIDQLGGQTWERARGKVKKSLRNMAKELLAVHAQRELAPGFAFAPRDTYFEEFEATFPFEETPDQHDAIEDVLADMRKAKPMDRLVCGDVGYGKTEVAIRAAFRAAMDGKQVAVLVPTTILCQQHYETFRKRFEGYPIRVASLSRFCSPREAREVRAGMVSGEIDIVIGTHRLLQRGIEWKALGLLVVDEEHRFGVAHKERIKKLKQTVDIVTLTATPIPRTLQMAFTGIRDLSVIESPPVDRLAVRTQAGRYSESLIREAILREVRRGGQVFFVHNRVQSIGGMAEMLERVVPEVRVLVAHGQMKERELEDRMLAFLKGDADVLLCTTIIESGLDIPRANTIVINRAHALGLAQLYQLRGRVGRSHHRAYAYLLIPEHSALTRDAARRLEAIQDLSALGSGFRLANMDLEIRGAGNLLGQEQHGNLAAVGYEAYMEMLWEAVEELRGHRVRAEVDPEVRLPVPARLPEAYVPDVSQRLVLYKRLAGAQADDELAHIRDELLDRYGPLPDESQNLLDVIRVKIRARQLGVAAVDLSKGELALTVAADANVDPARLAELVTQAAVRVTPDRRIRAVPPPAEDGARALLLAAQELLESLGPRP